MERFDWTVSLWVFSPTGHDKELHGTLQARSLEYGYTKTRMLVKICE